MAKVIILASNLGLWGEELQAPWDRIKQAGHEVTLATPQGKTPLPLAWSVNKGFRDPMHKLINDPSEVDRTMELCHNGEWDNPIKIDEANMDDYDSIVIVGGFGAPLDLNGNPAVRRMVEEAWVDNKTIGALCYGVGALCLSRQPDNYKRSVIYGKTIVAHPMEWDFRIDMGYQLADTTPDNPGTTVVTPGFIYPLRPLVEDAVGPQGKVISPPDTTRENPCVYYDAPFVTGLSFESSFAFADLMVDVLSKVPTPA